MGNHQEYKVYTDKNTVQIIPSATSLVDKIALRVTPEKAKMYFTISAIVYYLIISAIIFRIYFSLVHGQEIDYATEHMYLMRIIAIEFIAAIVGITPMMKVMFAIETRHEAYKKKYIMYQSDDENIRFDQEFFQKYLDDETLRDDFIKIIQIAPLLEDDEVQELLRGHAIYYKAIHQKQQEELQTELQIEQEKEQFINDHSVDMLIAQQQASELRNKQQAYQELSSLHHID